MRGVKIALAAGLAILAASLVVVLSGAPMSVAGTNGVAATSSLKLSSHGFIRCEQGGSLPQGTRAIRVSLSVNSGPAVDVKVLAGTTVLAEGSHQAGWGVDETVTVPVARVPRTVHDTVVCTTVARGAESIQANGTRVGKAEGVQGIRLRIEYLRPGPSSWLSLASSVARRMGFDRAPGGAWVAYLAIVVMIAVSVLASRLVLRDLS